MIWPSILRLTLDTRLCTQQPHHLPKDLKAMEFKSSLWSQLLWLKTSLDHTAMKWLSSSGPSTIPPISTQSIGLDSTTAKDSTLITPLEETSGLVSGKPESSKTLRLVTSQLLITSPRRTQDLSKTMLCVPTTPTMRKTTLTHTGNMTLALNSSNWALHSMDLDSGCLKLDSSEIWLAHDNLDF